MLGLVLGLVAVLALIGLANCEGTSSAERHAAGLGLRLSFPDVAVPRVEVAAEPRAGAGPDLERPGASVPYACERFEVRLRDDGQRTWHKRLRRPWDASDRERFRDLVGMVAKEMGADPRLIKLWALRESTYNPYAIHVLSPDLEAAENSWRKHRWDPDRAASLEDTMVEAGAQAPEYWRAKADLARISTFRENRFFDDRIAFEFVAPDGQREPRTASYWGLGYGPFGFNPTYFLPAWDATAPPWVFCGDDGIAAIVTAVWVAREDQRECEALGYAGSNEVVNRRFSSGHCEPRPNRAMRFRKRARGLDPSARAALGEAWPAADSDRAVVVEAMATRAEAAGLLSRYALAARGL